MAKKKKQKISRHLASSMKDQDGKVVSVAELTEEVAGAQVGGVRQWISGHPADGMTPIKLASILRAADQGEVEAYFELAEDIEERDSHYLAQLATRRRSVSQLPITVTPASDSAEHKKHAEFLREWIKTGVLRSSLFDMLDAIGKAISVMEVDWHHKNGKVLPRALVWRTQRWFTFDRADGETLLLREGVAGEPLIPHKFVVHRSKAKSGLTIRSGIARVAVWLWMFKSFTVKDWAVFIQNYGQPIRIGKYGRGATEQEKGCLVARRVGHRRRLRGHHSPRNANRVSRGRLEEQLDRHVRKASGLVQSRSFQADPRPDDNDGRRFGWSRRRQGASPRPGRY